MSEFKQIQETITRERVRCFKDPIYFFSRYVKIPDRVSKSAINFELFDFQEKVLKQFQEQDYNIVLKSRQMGLSTLAAGYILHSMIFEPNTSCIIIANKQSTSKNLINTIKYMNDHLPSWLKFPADNNNELSLKLKNNSYVKAVSSKSDSGRSEAISILVFDEAAFMPHAEKIWASAQQTLATGGKAIIISTPNGVGNWYHKTWVNAEEGVGEDKFNPIKLEWHLHPKRDQNWLEKQKAIINDPRIVAQEILCSFVGSGNNVFEEGMVEFIRKNFISEPLQKVGFDSNTWIWKHPEVGRDYMVVADVSRGDSNDYSAFHILDLGNMEQVAEYKGMMNTKQYAKWLTVMASQYNDALLVVENNNVGYAALQSILDLNYKNLFWMYKNVDFVDEDIQIPKNFDTEDKSKMIPGFTTTSRNRPLMIEKLQEYLRDNSLLLHSNRTITEFDTFIWQNGRADAQRGYNDDLIMSLAIGCWVRDTALRLRKEGIEMTKRTMKMYGNKIYSSIADNDPWKYQAGNGVSIDLRDFI